MTTHIVVHGEKDSVNCNLRLKNESSHKLHLTLSIQHVICIHVNVTALLFDGLERRDWIPFPSCPSHSSICHRTDTFRMFRSLCCLFLAFVGSYATPFDTWTTADLEDRGHVRPQDAAVVTTSKSRRSHVQYDIRTGKVKARGVNLGSWLVAEHWMTNTSNIWQQAPDPNQGEYSAIAHANDPDLVRARFEHHHATFITEKDIAEIAAVGMNLVRVPVGYWIVGFDHDDPSRKAEWKVYSKRSLKYLDRLVMKWAQKYNLAVLLSVHAAKGSQNGQDHSSPSVPGTSYWAQYAENVNNSISMVSYLAKRYKHHDAFLGIGLLNEPSPNTSKEVLYDYYKRAYKAVRATGSDCIVTIAPVLTEQTPDVLTDFMLSPAYKFVWVEWHTYFLWGYDHVPDVELVRIVKETFQRSVARWNALPNHNRLFLGEWCFATSGKFEQNKELFYEFAQAETAVVNQAEGGWTYWSWHIDGDETKDDMWSLRAVLRDERLRKMWVACPGAPGKEFSTVSDPIGLCRRQWHVGKTRHVASSRGFEASERLQFA
ncbi:hypothetical protein PsorP6_011341 [Peronosclerospora sorghi]|uniref:Uncharacterized protein n=1 Tax=Peronosclerospora sorghi TaxID=230839 RepID=A0ACC0WM70_9STRA|nr:hypothetical protein PsorP6_011341 [Peronosclerospora sorghi]